MSKFLSTLSLRRATVSDRVPLAESTAISIHALLAESDRDIANGERQKNISIHALLAESDFVRRGYRIVDIVISIHALLAESDNFDFILFAIISISIHALLAESDDL